MKFDEETLKEVEKRFRKPKEAVNNPEHYNMGSFEVLDVINDWELNFNLGNVIKYVARCNYKGDKITDLRKAIFYIEKEIENEERNR